MQWTTGLFGSNSVEAQQAGWDLDLVLAHRSTA